MNIQQTGNTHPPGIIKEQDTPEIKFFRKSAKYRLFYYNRNQDILKELKTQAVLVQISNYNNKWIRCVSRKSRSRIEQAVMKYQPAEKTNTEHLLKRPVDPCTETRKGQRTKSLKTLLLLLLLLLYSTLVTPKLEYASVVWNSVTSTDA
jgi:hypothetical protein